MTPRSIRRAAERKAKKAARKGGIHQPNQPVPAAAPVETATVAEPQSAIPEPGRPFPLLSEMCAKGADACGQSEPEVAIPSGRALDAAPVLRTFESAARIAANRENALKSSGPKTEEGKAVSSQNRLVHGLARHNGRFALLPTEDAAEFDALRNTYFNEHQPANQIEIDFVQAMVESLWMRNRAQNLQPSCFDPSTGALADPKALALYIRYENTYNRAFSGAFRDLLRARAERKKAELGFEAQKRQEQAEVRAEEKHQMQKDKHYWEVLKKDAEACHELTRNFSQKLDIMEKNPKALPQLEAEFAKYNLKRTVFDTVIAA